MRYEGYNPITRMVEIAKQDGVDVLRYGIPTDIFVAEWENEYGMELPYEYLEEIEREFPLGLLVTIAAQYWASLDSWFTDFVKDYEEHTSK
jgi:hypothetical protein